MASGDRLFRRFAASKADGSAACPKRRSVARSDEKVGGAPLGPRYPLRPIPTSQGSYRKSRVCSLTYKLRVFFRRLRRPLKFGWRARRGRAPALFRASVWTLVTFLPLPSRLAAPRRSVPQIPHNSPTSSHRLRGGPYLVLRSAFSAYMWARFARGGAKWVDEWANGGFRNG